MYLDPKTRKVVLGRESVKPEGVEVVEGPESAYKTFSRIRGAVPKDMQQALGIMDVESRRGGKELRFRRIPSRIGTKKAKAKKPVKPTIGRSR